jgi:hypothetical protein
MVISERLLLKPNRLRIARKSNSLSRFAVGSLTELIIVDSSGWIEWFTKGSKASQYKKVIGSSKPTEIVTSAVLFYEVYKNIKS